VLLFLTVFFGCKKDAKTTHLSVPYNPAEPVKVTDFFPKEGGAGEQLVIYGNNFGNDTSIVDVFIGGKIASVIGVHDNVIYCLVPNQAYKGNIQVKIGSGQTTNYAKAGSSFSYQRQKVVTTLLGETDQRGN